MERMLFTVEPDDAGWLIRSCDFLLQRNLDKFVAIHRASCMAGESHATTGRPTGVHVRMLCGDGVLVGLYG